jgi:hypothetical protein
MCQETTQRRPIAESQFGRSIVQKGVFHLQVGAVICLLMCSCRPAREPSAESIPAALPSDVSLETSTGFGGGWLCLTLHLESGADVLCALETGSPFTVLDKSLEPKLGECLGTKSSESAWFGKWILNEYRAPKCYLGNTPLRMTDRIRTGDFRAMTIGPPVMGFLGMDCLQHYCLQLDFAARKIRFLDTKRLQTENLGTAFPLTVSSFGDVSTRGDFFGFHDINLLVDTGCTGDGALKSDLFESAVQKKNILVHETKAPNGRTVRWANFLGPDSTKSAYLSDCPDANLLGLGFLARHTVTLNFLDRTMYLLPRDPDALTATAVKFLSALMTSGRLPGWSVSDVGQIRIPMPQEQSETYPVFRTIDFITAQTISNYHCTVVLESKASPWRLQRAWRTDSEGRVVQDYPVP